MQTTPSFAEVGSGIAASGLEILQVNVGYRCNMSCKHCHVGAGPHRTEMMPTETIDHVLSALGRSPIPTLDITGGAPELHPDFRRLATGALAMDRHVMVRCNLTVLFEPGMEWLFDFYGDYDLEIIASLPACLAADLDRVRGEQTFSKSIEALRRLNALGYGTGKAERQLHLVYNPRGAYLPPAQCALEADYKRTLQERHTVAFDRLLTLANMPIGRFGDFLRSSNNYAGYVQRLAAAFNPATLDGVMCRRLISVKWDGTLYDCDFNQVLCLPLDGDCPRHIAEFDYECLKHRAIAVGDHCFGCTAGQGSSCGGAIKRQKTSA
ncbi:MAG TPA: arsenosugar biosynthesis radical SAM (seleno)protein ArsS [Dissulfurispiraceae bacterium]|nr:arsenosugar biosynthesis radical SAM (seleno)protein ArsS [Dissulfurispiraceae bacterium]